MLPTRHHPEWRRRVRRCASVPTPFCANWKIGGVVSHYRPPSQMAEMHDSRVSTTLALSRGASTARLFGAVVDVIR